MRFEFVPWMREIRGTTGCSARRASAMTSFCSPHVTIINYPDRPAGIVDTTGQIGSATSDRTAQETDPVATQIPDEAQVLLNEVLGSSDLDGTHFADA